VATSLAIFGDDVLTSAGDVILGVATLYGDGRAPIGSLAVTSAMRALARCDDVVAR
jgi:hypothetical protein